jgi:hypothetical protein
MAGNNEKSTQATVPVVCLYESVVEERSLGLPTFVTTCSGRSTTILRECLGFASSSSATLIASLSAIGLTRLGYVPTVESFPNCPRTPHHVESAMTEHRDASSSA